MADVTRLLFLHHLRGTPTECSGDLADRAAPSRACIEHRSHCVADLIRHASTREVKA